MGCFKILFHITIITVSLAATVYTSRLLTTVIRSFHHHPTTTNTTTTPLDIPSNASHFFESNGYNFIASLLHISPNLFLSTPETTIFAIPDSAMSNLSIPPYMTLQLINYHISPFKLIFQDLLNKPVNTCFITNFQQHKISITEKDTKKRLLEINNVLITHPDMFVHGPLAIHGVNGTFASFKSHQEFNELAICNTNNETGLLSNVGGVNNISLDFVKIKSEWKFVVKFMSSSGYAPFAFALYNVLDGIMKDHPDLTSMTIFAPPVFEVMEMPSFFVHKFMRAHIVPKKYSFNHLVSMHEGKSIKSLYPGKEVEITRNVVSFGDELLLVNRVEITSPDLLSSKSFVVHGIARAFPMDDRGL